MQAWSPACQAVLVPKGIELSKSHDRWLGEGLPVRDLNCFKGCLIRGAVGDALGYMVEFMPALAIFQKYGTNGIAEYGFRHGSAEISDDT